MKHMLFVWWCVGACLAAAARFLLSGSFERWEPAFHSEVVVEVGIGLGARNTVGEEQVQGCGIRLGIKRRGLGVDQDIRNTDA